MLKYTSVFYDLMMRSWPYTCVDQWLGFVHSVRKYTSVHSRTPPYIYMCVCVRARAREIFEWTLPRKSLASLELRT
ncbi:hypothetical protein Hanom_Chr01g00042311 [Helianthus anomalus]